MTTSTDTNRRAVWAAGLLVAAGAGVATAHGLYQVAAAARVPAPIAWLYPLITDGLALVAYAATSRLIRGGGRRYAAGIVVLAAGLSGLAQAIYLAGGLAQATGAPVGLRFGVGAWPAIAAALTAHLLHLIGTTSATQVDGTVTPTRELQPDAPPTRGTNPGVRVHPYATPGAAFNLPAVQPPRTTVEPGAHPGQHGSTPGTDTARTDDGVPAHRRRTSGGGGPVRERARSAARAHFARHGQLPTVTELMHTAQVARGTAGTVLKELRANRPALHVVNAGEEQEPDQ